MIIFFIRYSFFDIKFSFIIMSKISYRILSIDFNQSILYQIRKFSLFRLNLTQKPSFVAEEYFINKIDHFKNINHEFIIDDFTNNIDRLSMTIRYIDKQYTSSGISNSDCFQFIKNSNKIPEYQMRSNNNIVNFIEPKFSLIGCYTINLKEIKRGIENSLRVEILSRYNNQIIGYANLKIFISNIPSFITPPLKVEKPNNCSIVNASII